MPAAYGDDYAARLYHPEADRDLRTLDAKQDARIAALERRVADLEAILARQSQGSLPIARPGVVIIRHRDGTIKAQHILVHHTTLLDAPTAIRSMQTSNVAFVLADAAHEVLDALGIGEEATP
jgi:hypothetical protein